jgi:hypothetical protein
LRDHPRVDRSLTLGARRPWLMKPLTSRRTDAGDDDHAQADLGC